MSLLKKTIKLLLKSRSHREVADYAMSTYIGLIGNALYPVPAVSLILYLTYINALNSAIAAWGTPGNRGSKNDHNVLLAARAVLEVSMVQQANGCEASTPYDGDAFETAGWEVKNGASPSEVLPAPEDLRQVYQKNIPSGSAKLKCKAVKGAHSYIFSREPLAPETNDVEYPSTKGNVIVPSLISGAQYRFHVAAVGPKGVGVWSDVCEIRVI